uniref:Ligand-dependent corepressor isoform X1 n=2 Tax=Pogona vitticeps TaxID=103695 RepID=A0A6J0THK9_9SAUR
MASPCGRQECSIERRGFRHQLDSWRHRLLRCVGFESILEGLFGPELLKDLSLFKDFEPEGVSDWSFDENCLFCCLRREKVKEHLVSLDEPALEVGHQVLHRQEQTKIIRFERQAEEFLHAVFYQKDSPRVSDPNIPLVARKIMQRMIRQFAAEYTSKTSSTQDSSSPNSTKNQSLLKASPVASSSAGATAQNPVLSKLLMADQDSPLDLTVRKSQLDPSEQDGVLDLSTKKSPCAGSASLSHSPGCSTAPGNGEDTAEAKAINCLGQPKSPLEKFMVRLCTYHQKHFVRVLNDICTEVQTGCGGQQLPGPENMDVSTCSSSCSQYRTENQELGTSESKLPSCLDPEQSGPHGSLRLLCHALKQAVDLKSTDRRENCSPVVRRDFPEIPNIRANSANPRDSPTQGYLTASNSHHSAKTLEGQTSGSEQETGIKKGEEDKEQVQSRLLLDSVECRGGLQKNPFKVFPEEIRESTFTTSSPRRADKENSFQCSSKSLLHQDPEINDQEMKQKAENHHQTLAKCKGSYHMHSVDKTHAENAKDSWLPTSPMPVVHHKTTNGHTRAKNVSASSKSTRKSKRSSGLRINDYDNQCDVVYISQPITECHFESKRTVSSRKTARKSTRGYCYDGECCELPTVRTLAKVSHVQEGGNILAPQLEVTTSPSQGVTLPGGSILATAEAESDTGEKRASIVGLLQEDSSSKNSQGTAEQCSAEIIPPQPSFLEQRDVSSAEVFTDDLSLLLCPVSHAKESNLSVSSVQATDLSPALQQSEEELQDMTDTSTVLQADNDKDSCKNSGLDEHNSVVSSVLLSVSEAANTEENSVCLENESDSKSTILIDPEPPVCTDLLLSKELEARMDSLPPLEEPTSVVDLAASVEPPPLSPINPLEPPAELPAFVCLDPSVAFPAEPPSIPESVYSGASVASSRAVSPVVVPVSVVPEPPVLEPSEAPSIRAAAVVPSKEDSELPQPLPNLDTAELPISLQCANAYENTDTETGVDSSHGLQDILTGKHETVLPIADIDDSQGGENVKDTREISRVDEEGEIDSNTPSVLKMTEAGNREETSSKIYLDKKRKREKKPQVASDRCLRSQQTLLPAEDSTEEPSSSSSLQLPQLQIKLSKSPGAKRFKREVHLEGAASVCVPSDRFHKTLLNHTGNTSEQPIGEGSDITMRKTYKKLLATETAVEESQVEEGNKKKPGAMLEICLEASSDKRSVHVPGETSDKGETQTDSNPGAPEDTYSGMNATEVLFTLPEASCPPCPDSKNEIREGPLERSVKYKKPALQFYNLRHSPVPASVVTAYKSTPGKDIVRGHSQVIDAQSTANEDHLGFSGMEVLYDNKPKFVEWCAEEENQELITNFDAQYMKVQKGWIQLEKEVQPAPKVKNKSDKLKEIWKSKKRTRKFKGSTEVQKLSPVQMLFMKPFDMPDICKWFMETTETKSLVIVKKLNTRLPGDLPPTKLPLQKGCSSGPYPSSLQAERLKKHLKKFAALTPAKNTIRTQKMWAKLRESPEETELEQVASQQQTSPSEVSLEHGIETKSAQPPPSIPVQTSSRILRKYSNLRGKLHGLRRMVKQEKNDCVLKHVSLESKPSSKSLCIKSPVSAKLAQSVKAIPLPAKSKLVERGGKGKKGKDRSQEDISSKGNLQQNRKKTPNESSNRLQGQLSLSSKEKVPVKKNSKTKHVGTTTTKKQMAVERSNKLASQSEKVKKLADSQPGKRKSTTSQKGKGSTHQKSPLPSRSEGSAKPLKQKAVHDSSSRSLKVTPKKAAGGKALTRSVKRIQESNKAQGKKKLRAKEDCPPRKRRRLDTK